MINVETWLEGYRRAWIDRDPDAAAALFTENASYREQPYAEPFVGRAAIRDYWQNVTATQSDIELVYGTPVSVGPKTAVEWWATLRNDGTDVTLAGSFMLTFADDGACSELREYWHFEAARHTPPTGWGA